MLIKYPVYRPYLRGNEKKYVNQCLDSGWISSQGEFVEKFERAFANFVGTDYALSCSNGTTALHLALLALGIKPGDEVILPALTYVATANVVSYVGATPVFVDSEPNYFQLDPHKIEEKITLKTKAIIVVHLYGHAAQMDKMMQIAKKHQLYLIEDCAEAIGTQYHDQCVGTFGDVAAFSFYGNKTITTGEGGMVVTNHPELAVRVEQFKGQGVIKTKKYVHDLIGYNYRMTNICAAIGLAQLENIKQIIHRKIEIAKQYQALLTEMVFFHGQQEHTINTYWLISVLVKDASRRNGLVRYLYEHGIDTRPFFMPMHLLSIHKRDITLPVAERLALQGINLPSYPELNGSDVKYITSKINQYLAS